MTSLQVQLHPSGDGSTTGDIINTCVTHPQLKGGKFLNDNLVYRIDGYSHLFTLDRDSRCVNVLRLNKGKMFSYLKIYEHEFELLENARYQ